MLYFASMPLDLSDFDDVKTKAEELYKTLAAVECPYFKDKVYFNAQGLEHLKFKRHGKARIQQDQYMRIKLLYLAPKILRVTTTLQGIWATKSFEKVRVHNRSDMIMRDVEYYEFVAILQEKRVRIIVKRIGDGQKFFWSIIPHWRLDERTSIRKMHTGSPEDD